MKTIVWCLLLIPSLLIGEDLAFWPSINLTLYQDPSFHISTFAEHRTTEGLDHAETSLISSSFKYIAIPNLDLGINATYLRFSPLTNKYQKRLEFELNPHWTCEKVKFYLRNRIEFPRTLGGGIDGTRLRQKWSVEWPFNCTKLIIFHNNECFYDLKMEKFTQNRFIPLGIRYPLSKHVALENYYMLRRLRIGTNWPSTHIIGIQLKVGPIVKPRNGC